jgi:hypothetical protein
MQRILLITALLSALLFSAWSAQKSRAECISVDLIRAKGSTDILDRYCFPQEMLFFPDRSRVTDGALLMVLLPSYEGEARPKHPARTPAERTERFLRNLSISVSSAALYPPIEERNRIRQGATRYIDDVFGMARFVPEKREAWRNEDYFRRGEDLIVCNNPGSVPNPICTHEFSYEDLLVSISFGRSHLRAIFEMREKAIGIIEAAH